MRKLIIVAILLPIFATAQPSCLGTAGCDVRLLNYAWYTGASPSAPLQLYQEQAIHDTTIVLIDSLYTVLAGAISSAGDLDAVCTNGHITTTPIEVTDSSTGAIVLNPIFALGGNAIEMYQTFPISGGTYNFALQDQSFPQGWWGSSTTPGAFTYITSFAHATRQFLFPDEGSGGGLASNAVIHVTKDSVVNTGGFWGSTMATLSNRAINIHSGLNSASMFPNIVEVYNGSAGEGGYLFFDNLDIHDLTGGDIGLIDHLGTSTLYINDPLSGGGFSSSIAGYSGLTQSYIDTLPAERGYFALINDTIGGSGLGVLATTTSNTGWNSRSDTWTGNYTQHGKLHNVTMDSFANFNFTNIPANGGLSFSTPYNSDFNYIYNTKAGTHIDSSVIYTDSLAFIRNNNLSVGVAYNLLNNASFVTTGISGSMRYLSNSILDTVTYNNIDIDYTVGSTTTLRIYDGLISVTHIGGLGNIPTATVVSAATGSGTSSIGSGSTDMSGLVKIITGTGTVSGSNAALDTVNFSYTYNSTNVFVSLRPANAATAALLASQPYVDPMGVTSQHFVIYANTIAMASSTTYEWWYEVTGY